MQTAARGASPQRNWRSSKTRRPSQTLPALSACANRGIPFGHPIASTLRSTTLVTTLSNSRSSEGSLRFDPIIDIIDRRSSELDALLPTFTPFFKYYTPLLLLQEALFFPNFFQSQYHNHGFSPGCCPHGTPGELSRLCRFAQRYRTCRDLHAREQSSGHGIPTLFGILVKQISRTD